MPCYTVRLAAVEFKVQHQQHLIDGLKAAGYQIRVSQYGEITATINGQWVRIANGKAETIQGNEHLIDAAKRAYSHQVVKVTAKKYGWALSKKSANEYVAQRR